MCDSHNAPSRRDFAKLGLAGVGGAMLLGGSAHSAAAAQLWGDDGELQDPFTGTVMQSTSTTSPNGWGLYPPTTTFTVPGTTVRITVRSGEVATVLAYVATQFHTTVESLKPAACGGYVHRTIGGTSTWSNHASGTAIDLNWNDHPWGATNTFTPAQREQIATILAYCGSVVRWGGNYSSKKDDMHFEINVPPGDPRLAALAARILAGEAKPLPVGTGAVFTSYAGAASHDVFAVASNGMLRQKHYANSTWSGWMDIGPGRYRGAPAVVATPEGRYDVFGTGLTGNLYQTTWAGQGVGSWTYPTNLQGSLIEGAAAVRRSTAIDVVGVSPNNYLYNRTFNGTAWSWWQKMDNGLGATFTGSPAISYSNGRYDLFCQGTDKALYHSSATSLAGPWTTPTKLGGVLIGSPASVRANGLLHVFCLGVTNNLYQRYFTGTSWSNWINLGGNYVGTPAATFSGTYLVVYGVTPAGTVCQHIWQAGQPWIEHDLGGSFLT